LLTGEELNGIQEAEKVTKKKRVQRRYNTCNKRVTNTAVDTTSDNNTDNNSNKGQEELLDCIEVVRKI